MSPEDILRLLNSAAGSLAQLPQTDAVCYASDNVARNIENTCRQLMESNKASKSTPDQF